MGRMTHPRGATARALAVLKCEGVKGVLSRTTAKMADLRPQVLLECDLTKVQPHAAVPGASFLWASMDDLTQHAALELVSDAEKRTASETRLRRGDLCLVGLCDGVAVTYLWITKSLRELPRLAWPVRPEAMFVYKTFTLSQWRGRGLNRAALSWAFEQQRSRGCHTAFVDVDASNDASLRALRAAGFTDAARFYIVKLGPLTFTRMTDDVYARVSGTIQRSGDH